MKAFDLKPWHRFALMVFAVLCVHGAMLGLTDDEAYYWVLAQNPGWGFAFHPPGVVWSMAVFQALFGWIFGDHSPLVARMPAAFYSALLAGLGLYWMRLAGAPEASLKRGGLALISFAGLFGASWMIVPDLPLIGGWAILFTWTWKLCFERVRSFDYALLGLGAVLVVIGKYSGVLAVGSAALALLAWAPRQVKMRGIGALAAGAVLALIPILIWNAQHEWGSFLYQVRDRHGGELSWKRFFRFWGIEAALAGPVLVGYALLSLRRALRKDASDAKALRVSRFVAVWILPSMAVFCVQPLFGDFKPHWAFVVWIPAALELGWAWASGRIGAPAKVQVAYGTAILAIALISCHVPATAWMLSLTRGADPDPRLDVTNDMYGWEGLGDFLAARGEDGKLPIVGSRYQTASQAALALRDVSRVTQIPRDFKQIDEYPDLGISDSQGPGWPKLLKPALFVADNRYDAGPGFQNARCEKLGRVESKRWRFMAKWIDVWKCQPTS